MSDLNEMFWKATIEEMQRGYIHNSVKGNFTCLICGEQFTEGLIYQSKEQWVDAGMAVKKHISDIHGSVFHYLINLSKRYTGLTDIQKEILEGLFRGYTDKEIVKNKGGKSSSTIRNHRFKLREKEKQARVYLALMGLLESDKRVGAPDDELVELHREATMVDERYVITQAEKEKVLKNYIKDGKVIAFPSKEKKKLIILQHIMEQFPANRSYTEKEVNEIIKHIIEDYVTVRRYLIQYGFLDRKKDGSQYWVKG